METGHVSIRREYERGQYGYRGAFRHFVVSRSVTVRQRDLERFDEYLDALVSCAEMEVDFSFESSRIHAVRAETRLKAVMAARDKAAAMAGIVGAKLGHPCRRRSSRSTCPGKGISALITRLCQEKQEN